jgi:hypothetical protein
MSTRPSSMDERRSFKRGRSLSLGLYAVLAVGVAVFVTLAALSLRSGGLPGTKDSPSATAKGESTTGKTAAD